MSEIAKCIAKCREDYLLKGDIKGYIECIGKCIEGESGETKTQ